MSDRGRVRVKDEGQIMRLYMYWRLLKGMNKTQRAQIDLCHFMRVILIFAPWRIFWQHRIKKSFVSPALALVSAIGLASLVVLFFRFTGTMITISEIVGFGVLLVGIIFGIALIIDKNPEKWERRFSRVGEVVLKITKPIWWPVVWIAKKLGKGIEWFFTKRLFSFNFFGELISFIPGVALIATIMVGNLLFLYSYLAWWRNPLWTLVAHGIALAVIGLIILIVIGFKKLNEYEETHPVEEKKPKKDHEAARVVWQYVVAKKHRICPLIEIVD